MCWNITLRTLGIQPESIQNIALSHGHFDHTSGLIDVLCLAPEAKLCASPDIVRMRWGDAGVMQMPVELVVAVRFLRRCRFDR